MQRLFNNILLPLCLNNQAIKVIDDAMEFSNQLRCNLHLIFTPDPGLSFLKAAFYSREQNEYDIRRALKEIHSKVEKKLQKGLVLWTSYGSGNIQKLLADYSLLHNIDLICLSHKNNNISKLLDNLNVSILADQSNCPILSLRNFPKGSESKTIVLPIGESLPVNKLRIASYLGKQFHSTIHLVAFKNKDNGPDEFSYLGKAYRVLKDYTEVPVVCSSFEGRNLNEIAFDYAKKINAGLIVINPEPKPFISGFFKRLFWGNNGNNQTIPVLTVS